MYPAFLFRPSIYKKIDKCPDTPAIDCCNVPYDIKKQLKVETFCIFG